MIKIIDKLFRNVISGSHYAKSKMPQETLVDVDNSKPTELFAKRTMIIHISNLPNITITKFISI